MRDSIGDYDEYAIQKRINECVTMDSIKTFFYECINKSDSLTNTNKIANIITAKELLTKAKSLNYKSVNGKKLLAVKTEALEKTIKVAVAQNIEIVKSYIKAGEFMYPEARKLLAELQTLDKKNAEIKQLMETLKK